MSTNTAILLLSCPDQKGIVAEISHFIFINNGNILHFDQHTENESKTYFMRMEWDIEHFSIPKEEIGEAFRFIANKFKMSWQLYFSGRALRCAIFVSKTDHCLYEVLLRAQSGELPITIPLIIANHPELQNVAEYFNIPFYYIPVDKKNKAEAESRQLELLQKHDVELIILARYMQIISPRFIANYPEKIINIHHSFLPAFVGARPYHQAYARGVKIIGATSHYATAELDQGPIIEQDVVRVSHRDSIKDLIEKGKNLEKSVLSRAVKLYAERKILVFNNKTVVFD